MNLSPDEATAEARSIVEVLAVRGGWGADLERIRTGDDHRVKLVADALLEYQSKQKVKW